MSKQIHHFAVIWTLLQAAVRRLFNNDYIEFVLEKEKGSTGYADILENH